MFLPTKSELREISKYAALGGVVALIAGAAGIGVVATATLSAGSIALLAFRNKRGSAFGDDYTALYQHIFDRASQSDHPYEIQAVSDAFRLKGFNDQADQLVSIAQTLPLPPWPINNRPPPVGTRQYRGVAPREMQKWAYDIVHDPTMTFGMTKTAPFGDKIVIGRVEHHSWSTAGQQRAGGDPNARVQGAFKGVTLYEFV